jgi:thymidylate synthase (FAD)
MKIINASYEILTPINGEQILKDIEKIGRTCYKSENLITEDSSKIFVRNLIKCGHEAMLEHNNITVRFICDRGVSHELVRHRLASFAQESTRYCNYSKDKFGNELTFIKPCWFTSSIKDLKNYAEECTIYYFNFITEEEADWIDFMGDIEEHYVMLLNNCNWKPQQARSILPNSLKTEVVMSANIREWRHFFKLRCDKTAHPQMRELAIPLCKELQKKIPVVFDDIEVIR